EQARRHVRPGGGVRPRTAAPEHLTAGGFPALRRGGHRRAQRSDDGTPARPGQCGTLVDHAARGLSAARIRRSSLAWFLGQSLLIIVASILLGLLLGWLLWGRRSPRAPHRAERAEPAATPAKRASSSAEPEAEAEPEPEPEVEAEPEVRAEPEVSAK